MLKGGDLNYNPMNRTMIYAVIGVLFITEFVLSESMNCTKRTTACPNAAEWPNRSNSFNCSGYKRYVCLMASGAELREGCIFDSIIPAGRVGCPYTNQCDNRTGQPLLVTQNNYLPCPPYFKGCPPSNHSGYSILKIYKYPGCQGRNVTDKSSVPNKTPETMTTLPSARIPRDGNWTIIIICMILGLITASITIIIVIFRKEIKGRLKHWNSPVNDSIYYANDGASSIQSSEGNSKDLQKDYIANTEDIHLTTRIVPSVHENDVKLEPSHDNYGKEKTELLLRVQHSCPTKQEILSPDVTIENEQQDHIDEFIQSKGSTDSQEVPQSSCSSNDSVTSQVPMLKAASKKPKLKSFRRQWNSPSQTLHEECPNAAVTNSAEGTTRTQISEGNSVRNEVPDTKNREKALRIVRRMKEKSEKAEKCSSKTTTEYVKVLEKALQEYHQENKDLRKMMKLSDKKTS